jgi:hypothetical protein
MNWVHRPVDCSTQIGPQGLTAAQCQGLAELQHTGIPDQGSSPWWLEEVEDDWTMLTHGGATEMAG